MTLEQLRVFVAVAERQHVTKAAQALNLAQSAASNAIAVLEARHETKLFDRVGRTIELTEAGHAFLTEARAVLERAQAAEEALMEFGSLKRGTLSVQASQTIASYWLPRHLVAFRRAYPNLQIRFSIANTAQVVAAVENRTVELGFVEGAVQSAHLTSTSVARDQLVVVVAEDHPLEARHVLTADDLLAIEWVLREPGSGTRSAFEDALAHLGMEPSRLRSRSGTAVERGGARRRRSRNGSNGDLRLGCRTKHRSGPATSGGFSAARTRVPRTESSGARSQPRRGWTAGNAGNVANRTDFHQLEPTLCRPNPAATRWKRHLVPFVRGERAQRDCSPARFHRVTRKSRADAGILDPAENNHRHTRSRRSNRAARPHIRGDGDGRAETYHR